MSNNEHRVIFDPTKVESYRQSTKEMKPNIGMTVKCNFCGGTGSRWLSKKVGKKWKCKKCQDQCSLQQENNATK